MKLDPLIAERRVIPSGFGWARQHETDPDKIAALRLHMARGGAVPPVVVVDYGDAVLPLDGHHRTIAASLESLSLDAWVVAGEAFGDLECDIDAHGAEGRAEDYVLCAGVPAMKVAALSDINANT